MQQEHYFNFLSPTDIRLKDYHVGIYLEQSTMALIVYHPVAKYFSA